MTNSVLSTISHYLKHLEDALGTPSGDARRRERDSRWPMSREHM
jgi:hypothetical protein